jgi:hypothetical protein
MSIIRENDREPRVIMVKERATSRVLRYWIDGVSEHDTTILVRVTVANPRRPWRHLNRQIATVIPAGATGWAVVEYRPLHLVPGDVYRADFMSEVEA